MARRTSSDPPPAPERRGLRPRRPRLTALAAALRGRCPRCGRGRLFASAIRLERACEACGLRYDDDGSAVTVGMVFGFFVPLLAALPLGFALIVRGAPLWLALGAPAAVVVAAAPVVVRGSKVGWVWWMEGVGVLAGSEPPPGADAPLNGPSE